MKKLSLAFIITLMTLFAAPAHAWPEVDHMNMCGAAAKVIRDYKGNPKAWSDRDKYTESRKAALYFRANCPETVAGKTEMAAAQQHTAAVTHTAAAPAHTPAKPRVASCQDCFKAGYKKGLKDGQAAAMQNHATHSSSVTTPPSYSAGAVIAHGDHTHHSAVEKADCELTDALNRRAGPVVTIISRK